MRKLRALTTGLLASAMVAGCTSTNVTGYTDPGYNNRQYTSVVAYSTANMKWSQQLESTLCENFSDKGIQCYQFHNLFPPTRNPSVEQVFESLSSRGIESLLIVGRNGDNVSSQVVATQSYGSAFYSGNSMTMNASSMPIRGINRSSADQASIIDIATRQKAWVGSTETSGQGLLNTSDGAFIDSLSGEIVASLMETNLYQSQSN